MICEIVGTGVGILRRIKPYVPANILKSIYNALIQPYFDYCSPLWGVYNKTLRDSLQRCHGVSYESRSADVLRSLDWENSETRWYSAKATFYIKCCTNSERFFH